MIFMSIIFRIWARGLNGYVANQISRQRYEDVFYITACWRRLKIDHLEGFVPIEF